MFTTFFIVAPTTPSGPRPPHYRGFTIILRHTTLSRNPLDEWSARRLYLYLKTHNTHKKQTSTPPTGFEPTISAGERPQTHSLDSAATGTGLFYYLSYKNNKGIQVYSNFLFLYPISAIDHTTRNSIMSFQDFQCTTFKSFRAEIMIRPT